MKRLICLICLLSMLFVSVQSRFGAENPLYGLDNADSLAKQAEDLQTRLDLVNAILDRLENLDTLNSEQRELQEKMIQERETLLTCIDFTLDLHNSHEQLKSASSGGRKS